MEFSWQEWLLLILASGAVLVVAFTAYRIFRNQLVLIEFLENLKAEVGTDSGSTLAFRLEQQNKAMEAARVLAEATAAEWQVQHANSKLERETLSKTIEKLEQMFEVLKMQVGWGQQLAEARREAMEKGITLSVFQAAQGGTLDHSTKDIARDLVGRDVIRAGDEVIVEKK